MTDPELVALLDQMDAAAAEGERYVEAIAQIADTVTMAPFVPVEVRVLVRMLKHSMNGTLSRCPHLATGPVACLWLAWAPGKLRCASCAESMYRRIKGTAEDYRCDACRRRASRLTSTSRHLPAVLVDGGPGHRAGVGPITVLISYCQTCVPEAAKETA